jgi:hypothetical protein
MKQHRAFLLRCWTEAGAPSDDPPGWRYRLEEIGGDGAVRGFTSLDDLVDALRALAGATAGTAAGPVPAAADAGCPSDGGEGPDGQGRQRAR